MNTLRASRLSGKYILVAILAILLLGILFPVLILFSQSEVGLDCASNDPTVLAVVQDVKDRLQEVGLGEPQFTDNIGIDTHIERLCRDEVTSDVLYTYADQIENLNRIGQQVGQAIPVGFWDVQTEEMQANNANEYQAIDALVNAHPEYAQLLIRAYNRFYTFKQKPSTDTALDTGLDILLYTVDYYEQLLDVDFDTMDEATTHEIGLEIAQTWLHLIGYTPRINPLTDEPLFQYSIFSHFSITDMWRHQTRSHSFIGLIWGISGFDFQYVGDAENSNQVEHIAVSLALQYVYDNSLLALNALEIRDTVNGKQRPVMSIADQAVNNIIASEFIPYFEEDYVQAINRLRCILSSSEVTFCT